MKNSIATGASFAHSPVVGNAVGILAPNTVAPNTVAPNTVANHGLSIRSTCAHTSADAPAGMAVPMLLSAWGFADAAVTSAAAAVTSAAAAVTSATPAVTFAATAVPAVRNRAHSRSVFERRYRDPIR